MYDVRHEPVLHTFGFTWRALGLPFVSGGIGLVLALKSVVDDGMSGVGAGLAIGTVALFGVLLVFGLGTRTVVRPSGITLTRFGLGSRAIEWARVLDIRISPVPGQARGWGQAVLYLRAPDGSIEPLVAPHLSTYALGSRLPSAVAYLNDQRLRASWGRQADVDPRGVAWVEQQRLARMQKRLGRNFLIGFAFLALFGVLLVVVVIHAMR